MSQEVKVPVLPESVSDATVAAWHKKAGDSVRRDENLVDLETDKVVLEVPAPCDGKLLEIKAESGETVTSDDILAIIEAGEVADEPAEQDAESDDKAESTADSDSSKAADADLSPAVRRLVEENSLDPANIKGTGRDGRLTKEDVLSHLKSASKSEPEQKSASKPAPAAPAPAGARPQERVTMSRMRGRIAERMMEAQSTTAMLTSFNEVDLKAVMNMRKQHKEAFENKHGVRLGLMSFFVKAACEALKKHPIVNASVDGNDVIYHGYADVGIAVSTEKGLVVPILRNAEQMSFAEIESGIRDYAMKAREGGLTMDDLSGGTFTITNGGVFGSLLSTPILNPPQSAIMGLHTIKDRAVVVDGEVVARPMMYIALTYDHRIIDGKDAVLFLVAIKEALEDPSRLLLSL
ncbi:MAG: dihydrolipoyllysine-residue succinyltransferase component of 2-oxoglutarate dehydrogenase complex [Lysobacteraceae bacterium]|nr:MAG: dihydrolipoyllysine-residue succinyltransferase component of 2-oxoglutarate dehydrogenase complex [Xanthomonadaceae bacterium]